MAKKSKKQEAAKAKTGSELESSRDKKARKAAAKARKIKKGDRQGSGAKRSAAKKAGTRTARPSGTTAPDLTAVANKVKAKAVDLASNPLVAEVVAATLVAAAAAIKDPKKARAIAESVGDELGKAAKGTQGGSAMWQLAIDVAKRSMGALSDGAAAVEPRKGKGKKKD